MSYITRDCLSAHEVVGSVVLAVHGPRADENIQNVPKNDGRFIPEIDLATARFLNEAAIREHALLCSKMYRAGKFTRVGEDFLDEIKTDVECLIRKLRGKYPTLHETLEPDEGLRAFATGALMDKLRVEVDRCIGRMIQNKVQKQPTCGKTLGRTR